MSVSGHFVARQVELARLQAYLRAALVGQGQVVLIAGDAGAGKTALALEFGRLAQTAHPDLTIALGVCDPHIGGQSPYTPFREILAAIAGTAEQPRLKPGPAAGKDANLAKMVGLVGDAIMEFGPDLLGIFIPGASLIAKLGTFAVDQTGWLNKLKTHIARHAEGQGGAAAPSGLTQDQIFEQYVNVLRALSLKAPLLLVLDDLHWADTASIDLLFRLSRRLDGARILIIGTYRSNEVQIGRDGDRHPLEKVLNELRRYQGEVWFDLNQAGRDQGREFIDTYLDAEPNQLDQDFRNALYQHTGGHPLFTVELLRDLQGRGVLARDPNGEWILNGSIAWDRLPVRVEGVIAERVQSLAADLREYLTTASVEGELFTAEVVGIVQSQEVRQLVRRFSTELEKTHQLVHGQAAERVGAQRISHYRFSHNLTQHYLYQALDSVERSFMHESVGLALEQLYGDQSFQIAAQLARHFDQAGMDEKAATYYRIASDQAAAGYANEQALIHINRALQLSSARADQNRYEMLVSRERIFNLQGARTAQQADLAEMAILNGVLPGDAIRQTDLTLSQARLALDVSDYVEAIRLASAIFGQHENIGPRQQVEAFLIWSRALHLGSDSIQALSILERALPVARANQLTSLECRALEQLGTLEWGTGNYPAAMQNLQAALAIARQQGDLRREWSVLNNLGVVAGARQEYANAAIFYQQALPIVQRIGDRMGEMILLSNLGEIGLYSGHYVQAAEYASRALTMAGEIGNRFAFGISLINLGDAYREMGDYRRAEAFSLQALEALRAINYRIGVVVVLENLARIALAIADTQRALTYALEAAQIALEIASPQHQASSLAVLGAVHMDLGNLDAAGQAYTQSSQFAAGLGAPVARIVALGGLARIAYIRSIPDSLDAGASAAAAQVDEILDLLQGGAGQPVSNEIPLAPLLVCIQVLHSRSDPRAFQLCRQAQQTLRERADRITDPALCSSYLNIPENAALHALRIAG